MARLCQVGVAVDHLGFKEEQLATALERADGVCIGRVTVQVSLDIQAQLGHIGVLAGIGAQEEALAGRQAKAKIVFPVGFQREAAVHIQVKAWQADVQRQIEPGTHDATAQVHVKADRVGTSGGQRHAWLPGRDQVAVVAIKANRHVVDRDQLVAVAVQQDVQATEDIEQLFADQLDRLALARELDTQVLQQTGAQSGDHRAGFSQPGANEGQVRRHRALEQVLHRAQAQVDAIEHIGRVVEQLHQGAAPGRRQVKVGQLDHQGIRRVGRGLAHQLIDQGLNTARTQGRVGRNLQLTNLDVLAKDLGRQRQGQIKRTQRLDHRLAIDPGDAQAGGIGQRIFASDLLVALAVGIEHQAAALDTHLQWADLEVQVDVVCGHAGLERHARALVGGGVVVLQPNLGQLAGLLGQGHAQAQLQVSAQGQGHRAFARGVEELAQAVGQAQAGQIGQALQIEVQTKLVLVSQLEVQVKHELAAGVVYAQVEQILG